MVAKGKDASDLFPAVVKNVVSKNLEVGIKYKYHWSIQIMFLMSVVVMANTEFLLKALSAALHSHHGYFG